MPTSTARSSRSVLARAAAVLVAALALGGGSLAAATAASAAEIPDAISNITVTNDTATTPIRIYQTLRVTADWSVPDNTAPGTTFSMVLPGQLRGLTSTFDLTDADGAVFGDCTVDSTQVLCTLSDLVTTRPLDVGGTLFFSGRFTSEAEAGQTNDLAFDTGNQVVNVPVAIAPGVAFNGNGFRKDGSLLANGAVQWYINFPSTPTGSADELTDVVVTDTLGDALRFTGPDGIVLRKGTGLNAEGTGPNYNEIVDRALYTVDIVGQQATITIPTLPAGPFYAIFVDTTPVDPAGPFDNEATLAAAELPAVLDSVSSVDFAAGGDGDGNAPAPDLGPAAGTPAVPGAVGGTGVGGRATLAATGGLSGEISLAVVGSIVLMAGGLLVGTGIRGKRRA